MNRNIAYQAEQLARYFSRNRVTWPQIYELGRLGNEHGEALRLQLKLPAEIQDVMEVA